MNLNLDWFSLTLIAIVFFGILNFLHKVAASQGCRGPKVVNRSAITVTILSFILVLVTGAEFTNFKWIIIFAFLNSTFFTVASICKIQALKYIPTSYAFPLNKMSVVIVILLSTLILSERPTGYQWLGLAVIFFMGIFIGLDSKSRRENLSADRIKTGIMIALLTAFFTGFSVFFGKLASTRVPKLNYILISYLMVAIYTAILNRWNDRKIAKRDGHVEREYKTLYFGMIIGVLNFVGYYIILQAFSIGPLSLIQSMFTISMILSILLSVIFLKEEFNFKRGLIVLFACLGVILIKIG